MTERVKLRLMQPGEEAEVCALVTRVFDQFVAPDLPAEGVDEFYRFANPEALNARRQGGNQVVIAVADSRIVGMLELQALKHIAMLFVEDRGKGTGRRLFEHGLQICRDSAPDLREVTVKSSPYAVSVYQKLGFVATGPEQIENGIVYTPMVYRLESRSRGPQA